MAEREALRESLAGDDATFVIQALTKADLRITQEWGDVIKIVLDVAPKDDEYAKVLATADRRHNCDLMAICNHLHNVGMLRDDVDARMASRIITYFYGIDGD